MSRELLRQLIQEWPKLHLFGEIENNWGVAPDVLEFLYDCVEPGMSTLETGAGYTTIAFALKNANHVCINPNKPECQKIKNYCEQLSPGSTSTIRFVNQRSEDYLPVATDLPSGLDIVFIDGDHRYPIPDIDWHYTDNRLKIGGLLVVDDADMPSVKVLDDFIRGEDQWQEIKTVGKTAFYRKVGAVAVNGGWRAQKINEPYARKISQPQLNGSKRSLPERAIRKLIRLLRTGR